LKLQGGRLIAYNDVTNSVTAIIDLSKSVAIEDINAPAPIVSPQSRPTHLRHTSVDSGDDLYAVERSFRVIFKDGSEISFFADDDETKDRWLRELRNLVGRVPKREAWAGVLVAELDRLGIKRKI
jgi:hypothetical protein